MQRAAHPRTATLTLAPPTQIGTDDGRIKLVGAASTEATLIAPAATATASLHILPNTGCLLRLDTAGTLELWSVPEAKCKCTLVAPGGDAFTVCHPLPHDPYALLGTAGGAIAVVALLSGAGEPLGPARAAEGMRVMPFALPADTLGAPEDTPVAALQSTEAAGSGLQVLVLHEWHGLCVYSFDQTKVRARQSPALLHYAERRCCLQGGRRPARLTASAVSTDVHGDARVAGGGAAAVRRRDQGAACRRHHVRVLG